MSLRTVARRSNVTAITKTLKASSIRSASSHASGHDEHHDHHHSAGPEIHYKPESFFSRPFQIGAAFALSFLALNEIGFFDLKDGQHPITKWIGRHAETPEEKFKHQVQHLSAESERASAIRTLTSAEAPRFTRLRNLTGFIVGGGDANIPVGSQITTSDVKVRTDHPERELERSS